MLPKIICAMLRLCNNSGLRVKNMSKRMGFSWKCNIVELHMLTPKIPIIRFGVTNVDSTLDAGPCFVHVCRGSCKFEIIHIDDQHTVVFSMIKDALPYIRENLFPTFFADT